MPLTPEGVGCGGQLQLATSGQHWPSAEKRSEAAVDLSTRYDVAVLDIDAVPDWVLSNVMSQGAPPDDAIVDLDEIVGRLLLH